MQIYLINICPRSAANSSIFPDHAIDRLGLDDLVVHHHAHLGFAGPRQAPHQPSPPRMGKWPCARPPRSHPSAGAGWGCLSGATLPCPFIRGDAIMPQVSPSSLLAAVPNETSLIRRSSSRVPLPRVLCLRCYFIFFAVMYLQIM